MSSSVKNTEYKTQPIPNMLDKNKRQIIFERKCQKQGEMRSKSRVLLDELYDMFKKCDENCSHCDKLIWQLHEHISKTHGNDHESKSVPGRVQELEEYRDSKTSQVEIKLEPGYVECNSKSKSRPIKNEETGNNIAQPTRQPPGRKPKDISFTCRFCDLNYFQVSDYEFHFKSSHPTEELYKYKCKTTRTFDSIEPRDTQTALRTRSTAATAPKQLTSSQPQKKGFILLHTGEKMYTHAHSPPKERNYTCEVCAKTFKDTSSLNRHRLIHTVERKYVCEVCGKCFKTISNLCTHRVCHQMREHECNRCELKFKRRTELISHFRSHTGEKPFMCELCGKSFGFLCVLTKHRKIHTKQRKKCRKAVK